MMMMAARERGPLADLLAKKKIQAEAIAAGYRITCLQCGAQWVPTLRGDRRLPTGYWRCPNGCNVPAPSPAASATAEPAPMIDLASLPALLTTDEVAAALRLHPTTVKLLMRDGKLPGRKIGGQWRLLKSDLLAYLGADFTGPAEPGRASTVRPVNEEADLMSDAPITYTCDECGYQAAERDLVVEHLRIAHGITDAGEVGSVEQRGGLLILRSGASETVIDIAAWAREHLGWSQPAE